jgi:hypothetical protein
MSRNPKCVVLAVPLVLGPALCPAALDALVPVELEDVGVGAL